MDGQIRPRVPTAYKPRVRAVEAPGGGVRYQCRGFTFTGFGASMDEAVANWERAKRAHFEALHKRCDFGPKVPRPAVDWSRL